MRNQWSPERYIHAYRFAAEAHNGQKYSGTELPYIMHLSFVSMEVIAALAMPNEHDANLAVTCSLLHDVLEDTGCQYEQILDRFGRDVAEGVKALTKDARLPKPLQMEDSLRRIRQQPHEVWMVKMADRITNLQPPPSGWSKEKARQYREEAIVIHGALNAANETLSRRLLDKIEEYGLLDISMISLP